MSKSQVRVLPNDESPEQIVLSGDLSIQSIESLKKELYPVVKDLKQFDLVLENVSSIDLTGVQLVMSVIKSGEDKGERKIKLIVRLEEDLQEQLAVCGLLDFMKQEEA